MTLFYRLYAAVRIMTDVMLRLTTTRNDALLSTLSVRLQRVARRQRSDDSALTRSPRIATNAFRDKRRARTLTLLAVNAGVVRRASW